MVRQALELSILDFVKLLANVLWSWDPSPATTVLLILLLIEKHSEEIGLRFRNLEANRLLGLLEGRAHVLLSPEDLRIEALCEVYRGLIEHFSLLLDAYNVLCSIHLEDPADIGGIAGSHHD